MILRIEQRYFSAFKTETISMNIKPSLKTFSLPMLLLMTMALTRFHHFGSAHSLPDASLAVFFFAGFFPRRALFFMLLAEAVLIDYLEITHGTSSFCVSPAYIFLLAAYGVMWGAGRWAAMAGRNVKTLLSASLALLLATSAAFLISNGSFYLFSGRFAELNWYDYATGVQQYYPPYLAYTLIYAGCGYLLKLWSDKIRKYASDNAFLFQK
jgi:hypothetical protein